MNPDQQQELIGRIRGIARRNGWAIIAVGAQPVA